MTVPPHPAKYSDAILDVLTGILLDEFSLQKHYLHVLDPMAGVGGIHKLQNMYCGTTGVEIEQEWADAHERTQQGNATAL